MATGDGNGWVTCRCGHRHWGLHGAAGLLLVRVPGTEGTEGTEGAGGAAWEALLQLRAAWTDQGGTWGLPGGAADSHEDAPAAALREAWEETGVEPGALRVLDQVVGTDHGDWRYTVVLATAVAPVHPDAANAESDEVRWVSGTDAPDLPLHHGLAETWAQLSARVEELLPELAGA